MNANTQNQVKKESEFNAEFMRGHHDCEKGVPHRDQGEGYNRGYGTRYELEQMQNPRAFN